MSQEAEWKVRMDETGAYEYELPNGETFTITVPIGLCTQKPVKLSVDEEDLVLEIYHNNTFLDLEEYVFSEQGDYTLSIITNNTDYSDYINYQYNTDNNENINNQYNLNNQDIIDKTDYTDYQDFFSETDNINYQDIITELDNIDSNLGEVSFYKADIYFQVCAPVVSGIEMIKNTDDFKVSKVVCNGKEIKISKGLPDWSEDGIYDVFWEYTKDKDVIYKMSFELDRTAPELFFSDDINKAVLSPPVSVKPSEEGCRIQIVKGAEKYEAQNIVITENGKYQLTVTDKAGNTNDYKIIVGMPMNKVYGVLVILLVLMLGVAFCIMRNARKHTQVL